MCGRAGAGRGWRKGQMSPASSPAHGIALDFHSYICNFAIFISTYPMSLQIYRIPLSLGRGPLYFAAHPQQQQRGKARAP